MASLNPYNPRWIEVDSERQDALWEGMRVRFVGDEGDDNVSTVIDIRDYDGDVDDEGRAYGIPTAVKIEADGEWWHLSEVEFLEHEIEQGQRRYDARALLRKGLVQARPTKNCGYSYYGPAAYRGVFRIDRIVIRRYDEAGKQIFGPDQPDFPF